jgi:tyrosyl-tRNA synthetase
MADFNEDRGQRKAQKTLAFEVTKLVHGEEQASSVKRVTEVLFGGGDYGSLQSGDFDSLASELPLISVRVGDGLQKALVDANLASSNSEARRFLEQNAVYLNGNQVSLDKTIQSEDMINGRAILRRGKNSNAVLQIAE